MKKMKKFKIVFLVMSMFLSTLCSYLPVQAANDNIALGKEASVSSVYPDSGKTGDKAVDGIIDDTSTKASRWSSKRIGTGTPADQYDKNAEQWLLVDLKEEYPVGQINIFWEGAFAKKYKVQYAKDGADISSSENFTDLLNDGATGAGWKKHSNFTPVSARYVRVLCQEPQNASWGYSIYEIEIFQQKILNSADDAIRLIEDINPTVSEDGTHIVFPTAPIGYTVSVYGSDNEQVVNKKGEIIQPLVAMDVKLMYRITNNAKPDDTAVSSKDVDVSIKGKFERQEGDNQKPNVVPGLREWKGSQGNFTLIEASQIVIDKEEQREAAVMLQTYFKSMLNREMKIALGTPAIGDIYLKEGTSIEEVGKEGYYLTIDDYVTITSPTYQGLIYGGASITQILYQDEHRVNAPKGTARDYPQYEVRSGMIDVGRMYIPLEYLQEMTVYMSWYKLNETHVHINDYWGGSGYSAFRLESETYPSIVAKDGFYTKDEYRQYQKDMKKYGMDVITEIDTPYHSEAFREVPGVKMLAGTSGYLDITTPAAFDANAEIIENLFDEYLDGEDPVFQSKRFHIGTDEYDKKYGEQMRKWTDHFIKYVNAKGYKSQAWASLGKNGFNGSTPVSNEVIMNLWAPYWSDVHETYEDGYDIINTYGGWLYIVPAANAGYPDRIDTKRLYEEFEVNNFKSGRNPSGEAIMPVAHPQTKGAEFALWNDMTSFKTGFSWFDIYDRIKDAVSIVAEKTWFGEDEEEQSYAQFRQRIDALQDKAANTNPGRYVESKTQKIAEYDLNTENDMVKDKTDNHYDAKIVNAVSANSALTFAGNGYLSLPMQSIGYPYTISMDMKLTEINDKTTLFTGKDGTLFADYNGKVGYQRGSYYFTFNYKMPVNQQTNLTLVCNQKDLILYVNGKKIGNGVLTNATIGGKTQQSSSFVLPVEQVFKNTKGTLNSFTAYNYAMSADEVQDQIGYLPRTNLSLKKPTQVSGLEVNDGRFTADKAVDGTVSNESRVSFAKTADEQWLVVDLEKEQLISQVVLNYESVVGKYEILVSDDGETFTSVYQKNEETVISAGAVAKVETVNFAPVKARYVKYLQKERWKNSKNSNWYSGSIYELEIYKPLKDELLESVATVEKEIAKYEVGTKNGQMKAAYYDSLQGKLATYKELAQSPSLSQDALESAKTILAKELKEMESHIIYNKQEAVDAYEELKGLDYHQYTTVSYQAMMEQLDAVEDDLGSIANYVDVNAVLIQLAAAKALLEQVDNQELVALIEKVKNLNDADYVSVVNLKIALKAAEAIYEAPASQEAINNAYEELQKQFDELVKNDAVNKAFLEALIFRIEEKVGNGDAYKKDENWVTFVTALDNAKKAVANLEITQSAVNEAIVSLSSAYMDIRLIPFESLKDELLKSIAAVENELAKYEVGTQNGQLDAAYYEALQAKLATYKELAESPSLSLEALENAKAELAKDMNEIENHIIYDKQEAVDAFEKLKGVDYHQYTTASYQAMKEQLNTIEIALNNITKYADVIAVLEQLTVAEALLEQVDNQELVALIEKVKNLNDDDYVSVVNLKIALKAAEEVYEAPGSQEAINNAYKELLKQFDELVRKDSVNKAFLEDLIFRVEEKIGKGDLYKKDENWLIFVAALESAKNAVANVTITQTEINEAILALSSAFVDIRLIPNEEQLSELNSFITVVTGLNRRSFSNIQLKAIDQTTDKVFAMINEFNEKEYASLQEMMVSTLTIINDNKLAEPMNPIIPVTPIVPVLPEAKEPSINKIDTVRPAKVESMNAAKPNTGDYTNIAVILCMLLVSGCGVIFAQKKRYRK